MLKVFMSYAKEDSNFVRPFFSKLKDEGFTPWMDIECLLPGQNWEAEIDRAFNDANVVILFLSPRSVSKRGFVQREANEAIDNLRYKQPTDIYVIPLQLEACDVPPHISKRLQYENLQLPGAWERVLASLKLAATQQQVGAAEGVVHGPFRVFAEEIRERWRGRPGHDISVSYPRFESVKLQSVAEELSSFFKGRAIEVRLKSRQKPWDQSPEIFEEAAVEEVTDEPGSWASNGRWDNFGIVHANDNVLSLSYTVGWYGAGAAHPNSHFETFNFAFVDGTIIPFALEDLFQDETVGIARISELCIADLQRQYWTLEGSMPDEFNLKWIQDGAGPDAKNFRAFTVSESHVSILFAPYHVAAYVFGSWTVEIPFFDLLDILRKDGIHTLTRDKSR
jgi:hypothetical protein